tara:strand:- start:10349 stop:11587 length:1239 start_codon:yes stop_codon:yes gene_type:complete
MKKNISIVGAGFTGIITAIILSKKYNVTIIEAKDRIGGILTDIQYEKEIFFKSCQYLNTKSSSYELLNYRFKNLLDIFPAPYSSYTKNYNNYISSNRFANPVFKKINIKKTKNKKIISLKDRFKCYDKKIENFLISYLKKFQIEPQKYVASNAINLQIDRITSIKDKDKISKLKKIKFFNQLYALDNRKMEIFHKSALPKNGYDTFFDEIFKYLKKRKIKILLNCKIIPEWQNKKLILKGKQNIFDCDYVVWTANPVALLAKYFKTKKLESKSFIVKQLDFCLSKNKIKNNYIQVFSSKSFITRIHFYKIKNRQKMSVECINFDDQILTSVIKELNSILKSFKIYLNDKNSKFIGSSKYSRYDLCSINDFKLIKRFRKEVNNTNLITSPWEFYGRENKIDMIIGYLKDKKIL